MVAVCGWAGGGGGGDGRFRFFFILTTLRCSGLDTMDAILQNKV